MSGNKTYHRYPNFSCITEIVVELPKWAGGSVGYGVLLHYKMCLIEIEFERAPNPGDDRYAKHRVCESPRLLRRLVSLSHAASADSSSWR